MKKKILFVEDDEAVRVSYSRFFCSCDVEALIASTLKEAFELFDSHNATLDAVISDSCVDNALSVDADTFIRHVIASGFTKPVIAQSGLESHLKKMKVAGATYCFEKIHLLDGIRFILKLD